jgi:hypothetical protein
VGVIGAGLTGAGFGFAAGAVCAADVRGTVAASKTASKIPETDGALKTPARRDLPPPRPPQRLDLVRLRCIADAGNLDDICPPHYPFFDGLERRPMAAPVGIPEHHVIGAGFAREHGIMTAVQTACAGDAIGL